MDVACSDGRIRMAQIERLLALLVALQWCSHLRALRDDELRNTFLMWTRLTDASLPLLQTKMATYIGITYAYLSFVTLPICAALERRTAMRYVIWACQTKHLFQRLNMLCPHVQGFARLDRRIANIGDAQLEKQPRNASNPPSMRMHEHITSDAHRSIWQ